MEGKGMIKKFAIGTLCLAVVALIALSVSQQLRLKNLTKDSESKTNVVETKVDTPAATPQPDKKDVIKTLPNADKGKEINKKHIVSLKEQLDSTEQEVDAANNKLSDELSKKAEIKKKELELQQQYLKDPSIKKYMRTSLETTYESIYKDLNLSSEKKEKFLDILTDQIYEISQLSPEIMSATTKEEKTDIQKRYDSVKKETNEKIKELLGSVDYEKYEADNDRSNSKYFISGFMDSLGADEKLTQTQEQELVEIMYTEEKKIYSEIGFNPSETIEFADDLKKGKLDERIKNVNRIFSNSVENSKSALSASQLEKLNSYLNNRREMLETSWRLAYQQ